MTSENCWVMYDIEATVTTATPTELKLTASWPLDWLQAPNSIEIQRKLSPDETLESWSECGRMVPTLASLMEWAQETAQLTLEIVRKPKGQVGFSVLPWRWIVERTFAWLGNYLRLARDYEINPRASEAWIKIAMIHLSL